MQTIALITKNRPEKENPRKGTLVVAPAALVDQVSPLARSLGCIIDLCQVEARDYRSD